MNRPPEALMVLGTYQLTIVELDAADEEVEEMFVRLQNGTTLRADQKSRSDTVSGV